MAVADQLAPLLIPQTEGERFEAGEERHWLYGLKQRIGPMTFREIVVGNPRIEVMDVMKSDVAGKPLQDRWQFVEGTALQRGSRVIPVVTAFPVHSFELMLHVKQPEPGGTSGHERRELDQQVRFETENHA